MNNQQLENKSENGIFPEYSVQKPATTTQVGLLVDPMANRNPQKRRTKFGTNLPPTGTYAPPNLLNSQIKKNPEILLNSREYYFALLGRIIPSVGTGYSFFIIGIVFNTIKNENNLNLNSDESAFFLSIVGSAFFIGIMGAPFLIPYFSKTNTKTTQRILVFVFALINILFIYPNMWTMALSRFLQGLVGRLLQVTNYWWIRQIALPKHRNVSLAYPLIAYAFTGVALYFMSFLDDGGLYIWRLIVAVPSIVLLVNLVIDLIMVRNLNSFTYLLQNQGYASTLDIMKKVYEEETAKQLTMEFHSSTNSLATSDRGLDVDDLEIVKVGSIKRTKSLEKLDKNLEENVIINKTSSKKRIPKSISNTSLGLNLPNIKQLRQEIEIELKEQKVLQVSS